jgi:hypothetical protein
LKRLKRRQYLQRLHEVVGRDAIRSTRIRTHTYTWDRTHGAALWSADSAMDGPKNPNDRSAMAPELAFGIRDGT